VAYLALFLALGGSSYAALRIGSRQIVDNSVRSVDVRNGTLTGRDIKRRSVPLNRLSSAPSVPVPQGAVLFFNSSSCPGGFTELAAARGRYIVGLGPGGTLGGTAGSALSNREDRPTGRHSHSVSDPQHIHPYSSFWGFNDTADSGTIRRPIFDFKPADAVGKPDVADESPQSTGLSVDAAGAVSGTNAPYLQLLACQKQ
jgi:hypothetical protein